MTAELTYWITIGLKDGATGPLAGISKALGELAKAATATTSAFTGAGKALDGTAKAAATATSAFTGAGKALDGTAKAAATAGAAYGKLWRTGHTGAKEVQKDTQGATEEVKKLAKEAEKLKALGEGFDRLKGMGTKVMGAGAAMVAPFAAAGYSAVNHEARKLAIDMPFKAADGTNRLDQYNDLTAKAAGRAGRSNLDTREAVAAALQGQMSGEALRGGGLDAVMDLAVVHGISEKTSASLLANLGDNYKVDSKDYARIADYMNGAAHEGGTGLESFAGIVAGLGGKAKGLGITGADGLEGMAIMATMLKKGGMDDGAAGASLGGLLEALPTLGRKAMNSNALMSTDVQRIVNKAGLGDISKKLFDEKTGDLIGKDGAEKLFTINKFFAEMGEKVGNAQDRLTLLKVVLPGIADDAAKAMTVDGWDAAAKAIKNHTALMEQAGEARKTAAERWKGLKASMGDLAASIGGQLLPVAKDLMEKGAAVIEKIKEWTEAHPALTKVIGLAAIGGGLLVTAVGGIMVGVGTLGSAITNSLSGWEKWGDLLTTSKAKVIALGNESAIAAAKTKLFDMGGGFKKGWNAVSLDNIKKGVKKPFGKGFWKDAWGGTKQGVGRAWGGAKGGAKALGKGSTWGKVGKGLMKGGKGLLKGGASALLLPFKALGGVFAGIAALGWPVLAVIAAIAAAALLVYKYWDPIKNFFKGVWSGIKKGADSFKEPWEKLKGAVKGIWNAFASIVRIFIPVKKGQDDTNGAFSKGESVGKALAKVLGWICTGARFVAYYLEGVILTVVTLVDAVVTAAKTIWYALTFQWGKIGDAWDDFGKRTAERWKNASFLAAQEDKALADAANTEAKTAEVKASRAEEEARKYKKQAADAKAEAKKEEVKAREAIAKGDSRAAKEAEERARASWRRAKELEDKAKGAAEAKKGGPVQKAMTDKERIAEAKRREEQERRIAENKAKWKAMTPEEKNAWREKKRAELHAKHEAERAAKEEEAKAPLKAAQEESAAAKARLAEAEGKASEAHKRLETLRKDSPNNTDAIARARVTYDDVRANANARKDELRAAEEKEEVASAQERIRLAKEQVENAKGNRGWSGFGERRSANKELTAANEALLNLFHSNSIVRAAVVEGYSKTEWGRNLLAANGIEAATSGAAATGATDKAAAGNATAPATSGGTGAAPEQPHAFQQPQQVQQTNTTTINYSPTVNLTGSATADDDARFKALLKKHKEELAKLVNEVNERNRRWTPGAGAA